MAKVLVIEDDLELLKQLAARLGEAGHSVETAVDGEVGVRKFQASPFDLVVTDIVMPVREGVETIIAIKQIAPAVKIVAISGGYRASPSDFLALAQHLGADATLAKPFRASVLLETVNGLLGRRDHPEPVAA